MEKMIRSRSTINTFFGQVDGEYYLGEKWLFTATVSAHQHLVRSIDKNIIPMDNQQPTDPNGNKTKVPVGYDKGRIELSGYVSIRYRPTERLGLSIGLREEMFGSEWTPIIPAFFTDYLISKRGNLVAKASISRNYRFPSLNDLYFLPGGNPDLKRSTASPTTPVCRSLRAATEFTPCGAKPLGSTPTSTTGSSGCLRPKDSGRPKTSRRCMPTAWR